MTSENDGSRIVRGGGASGDLQKHGQSEGSLVQKARLERR